MAAARFALRPRGMYSDPSVSRCSDDDEAYAATASSKSDWNSSYNSSVASDDNKDSSLLTNAFLAPRPFIFRDKPFLPGMKSSSLSDFPRFFCNYRKVSSFDWLTELRFHILIDTRRVNSEKLVPANLMACTKETKPNIKNTNLS